MSIQSKIEQLKAARETRDAEKTVAADLYEALKSNPDFKAWEEAKTMTKTSDLLVEELEAQVREAALEEYKAHGTKQPHERVTIKMFSIVKPYNEDAAREWCFSNFRPALTLDAKTFEKAVKDGQIPPSIAESDSEPRVTIATKL